MKTICTLCKSDNVFIVPPEPIKEPDTQTMDQFARQQSPMQGVAAVYKYTTMRCKKCGYEVRW